MTVDLLFKGHCPEICFEWASRGYLRWPIASIPCEKSTRLPWRANVDKGSARSAPLGVREGVQTWGFPATG